MSFVRKQLGGCASFLIGFTIVMMVSMTISLAAFIFIRAQYLNVVVASSVLACSLFAPTILNVVCRVVYGARRIYVVRTDVEQQAAKRKLNLFLLKSSALTVFALLGYTIELGFDSVRFAMCLGSALFGTWVGYLSVRWTAKLKPPFADGLEDWF